MSPKGIMMIAILILLLSACFSPANKKASPEPSIIKENKVADTLVPSIIDDGAEQSVLGDTGKKPMAKPEAPKEVVHSVVVTQEDKVSDTPATQHDDVIVMDEGVDVEFVEEKEEAQLFVAYDHSAWDALLQAHVSNTGTVNYAGLKNKESQLDAYLASLSVKTPDGSTPRAKAMAYWINVYNAFTVKIILKNYPVASIMNLHGGKAWDVKWIELNGSNYSLNQIEHDILRKKYPDPRIHFAVNCAAASCPPLLNKAWTEENLERCLENQTIAFINDPQHNQIEEGKLRLSKIFEWYKSDFGDLVAYISSYSKKEVDKDAKVKFNEYDWKLNGK